MKDTDIAYIAGYFDGEGCISVWRRKPQYSSISVRHVLTIQISSTDRTTLDWIKASFGGKMLYSHSRAETNQADAWKWIVSCKRAAEILTLILPYLKTKKPEAELALLLQGDMQEHLHSPRAKGRKGIAKVPTHRLQFRDQLTQQIKSLKSSYKRYGGEIRPAP